MSATQIEELYGLSGMDGWAKMAETASDLSKDKKIALPVMALTVGLLSSCVRPEDLQKLTPEAISQDFGPIKDFVAAWGNKIGAGVLMGLINGARAFNYRARISAGKEEVLQETAAIKEAVEVMQRTGTFQGNKLKPEEVESQTKALLQRAQENGKLINPLYSAQYIAKEAYEGALAGTMSAITIQAALSGESDLIDSVFLGLGSWQLIKQAIRR